MQILALYIPDMDTPAEQNSLRKILIGLHGLRHFKPIRRGMEIAYMEDRIKPNQICEALHTAGFHPSIFHDTASGGSGSVDMNPPRPSS